MSIIFVNGQAQTTVSALDRGILYGDSIFETAALYEGQILQLSAHIERLQKGLNALGIDLDLALIKADIDLFLKQIDDNSLLAKSVFRITITRGEQSRGYKPIKGAPATRILSLHSWPNYSADSFNNGLNVGLSDVVLSEQLALAKIKHGNRLEQVLAAANLQDCYDDAFMLNQAGELISATKGNVFIKCADQWLTPIIDKSGIAGITRDAIIQWFAGNNIACKESRINYNTLLTDSSSLQNAFICNSILGLAPVQCVFKDSSQTEIKLPESSIKECLEIRKSLIKQRIIAT